MDEYENDNSVASGVRTGVNDTNDFDVFDDFDGLCCCRLVLVVVLDGGWGGKN